MRRRCDVKIIFRINSTLIISRRLSRFHPRINEKDDRKQWNEKMHFLIQIVYKYVCVCICLIFAKNWNYEKLIGHCSFTLMFHVCQWKWYSRVQRYVLRNLTPKINISRRRNSLIYVILLVFMRIFPVKSFFLFRQRWESINRSK